MFYYMKSKIHANPDFLPAGMHLSSIFHLSLLNHHAKLHHPRHTTKHFSEHCTKYPLGCMNWVNTRYTLCHTYLTFYILALSSSWMTGASDFGAEYFILMTFR